jgi:hypothetical protein
MYFMDLAGLMYNNSNVIEKNGPKNNRGIVMMGGLPDLLSTLTSRIAWQNSSEEGSINW